MSSTVDNTKDPIYQVFQGIWDCLENNAAFAALVKSANRIKHTDSTTRSHDKPGLTSSDLPQVRVVQLGLGRGQIFRTSNSSSVSVQWGIEVKIGDKRLEELTELQWAIYCAMSKWPTYIRDEVVWESVNCARRLTPMQVETEYAMRNQPPDPAGWRCAWKGEVELFMTTTAVQAYVG